MNLYCAPVIMACLLSTRASHDALRHAAVYTLRVVHTMLSTFIPTILPWRPGDVPNILVWLFQFTRGLYEVEDANFCFPVLLLHKLHLPTKTLLAPCTVTTVLVPSSFYIAVACHPSTRHVSISTSCCALAAFLFSYPV